MYIITSSFYSLQGSNQDTTSDNPSHSITAEGPATNEGNIAVVLNTLFGIPILKHMLYCLLTLF